MELTGTFWRAGRKTGCPCAISSTETRCCPMATTRQTISPRLRSPSSMTISSQRYGKSSRSRVHRCRPLRLYERAHDGITTAASLPAYLGSGRSQLTFWHDVPEINPRASTAKLGEYYMLFSEKADYAGPYDPNGIPMLDYHGADRPAVQPDRDRTVGTRKLQPLLGDGRRCSLAEDSQIRRLACGPTSNRILTASGSGTTILIGNIATRSVRRGIPDWRRDKAFRSCCARMRKPGMIQYRQAAEQAFASLTKPIAQGGVLFEDENRTTMTPICGSRSISLIHPPTF